MAHDVNDLLGIHSTFQVGPAATARLVSLPALERKGFGRISRLPISLRIVLESVARNLDGHRITEEDVRALAAWQPRAQRTREIPFVVARVLLQDFTGVPLIADLAAMRSAMARLGKDSRRVEPRVPVDLVVDHSVQVDAFAGAGAMQRNLDLELDRNGPRYEFLKWGTQAFSRLRIIPPGIGICHQVNLEYLASGVLDEGGLRYPDTLVGTDSHTPMINGLGVLGWGVGGIEAEAAMLGQPVYILTPDVVGVHLRGALREGVTATDLVLTVTELLRSRKVVGKFVEFFGEGAASLPVAERATLSNMAPEYGATVGFFPTDERSLEYLAQTGRPAALVSAVEAYYRAQGMFGIPRAGDVDYSEVVELDLAAVQPSVAGPRRPQDRIELPRLKATFRDLLQRKDATGFSKDAGELGREFRYQPEPDRRPSPGATRYPGLEDAAVTLSHGDVLIAAITSCTNTSNPSVMLAAGLLAKKAVARGLRTRPTVKTSLAPGSRVVSRYLEEAGLQRDLDALGFQLVGFGCTTCIGNSGPLDERIEAVVSANDVVGASVLSGNRNFEARIHPGVKANFLMSPPLVVAFALAGRVDIDLETEPLGTGSDGRPVYLREIWPTLAEVDALRRLATAPATYSNNYASFDQVPRWNAMPVRGGDVFEWDATSTFIQEPPWLADFRPDPAPPRDVKGARALALFGDSVTTDHISPAGNIRASSPAGLYLQSLGVQPVDFNSYGSRRGNHHVMVRGTFANVRIRNLMVPGVEGGVTVHQPSGRRLSIYDASLEYGRTATPLAVLAGLEYGSGSSRDWAAKGPALLGVRFVVARSFERIHRSNLVGMGILPCQFPDGTSVQSLGLDGTEEYDLLGVEGGLSPRKPLRLAIRRADGRAEEIPVTLRIDTPIEVEQHRRGGIIPFVLASLLKAD
ncbi:MAG TPA: aconitate hydratase AcnA [Anaeromyxobacteraceae bacterium]|nr:aconitate hydratase AcnA [Anaeromyxobacteraceae bacterium]